MKRSSLLALLASLALLPLLAVGCREEPSAPPRMQGEVRASSTYITYFGQPPAVAEGSCFALVGFYPPADQPHKVRPFPLYLFNPEDHPQILTEQLLSWGRDWDLGGIFSNPFPPGSELISIDREGDLLRVELSAAVLEQTDIEGQQTITSLLAHSLSQFEGIERVMVVAGGVLLPGQAERGFLPDPQALAEPGPPVAVAVSGTWENGAKAPMEVSVFFDRPVRLDTFRLTDASGRELGGKYYRSVFDMAVVVHPANPDALSEGMPLHLTWRGKDFLDRPGQGDRSFALR